MKKITAVVMAAILLVMLLPDLPSEATTYYEVGSCFIKNKGVFTLYCTNEVARYPYMAYGRLYLKQGQNGSYGYPTYYYDPSRSSYIEVVAGLDCASAYVISDQFTSVTLYNDTFGYYCYVYSNYDNYYDSIPEEYQPEIPSDPTWYSSMWDELKEKLGDPAFWFGQWFIDIIDEVFGNGEQDPTGPPKPPTSTHVQINNPTITPAPTPIPYTTVVIPKTDPVSGDTYYEENYYYINPSGNPIITSSPPTNPPSQNGPGNGTDYSPVGGDPYSIPQVSWLTNATIGENDYDGILSISQGMDSIDEIGTEYIDGMGAVQDATGTLPTSWLLLIGIAAAIPLIAGIISRFLS